MSEKSHFVHFTSRFVLVMRMPSYMGFNELGHLLTYHIESYCNCTLCRFLCLQMGSALSEINDGPISLADSTGGGCQNEITKTTRTHLLCLSRAHNKFAIQLYQEFAKDGKRPGNFVICPISVSLGLGMLHLGSRGSSSEELHKVLYLQEVKITLY